MLSAARRRARSAGFTLVEVTIAMVLVVLLAGVVGTQLLGRIGEGEAAALAETLGGIGTGVQQFRADVGRYPRHLAHLASPPPAGAPDACGQTLPDVTAWNGPYLGRTIGAAGIPVGTAVISDTLRRDPASGAANGFGTLFIDVHGVDLSVATSLDGSFDADGSLGAGSVLWTATETADRGRLSFAIPIRGC